MYLINVCDYADFFKTVHSTDSFDEANSRFLAMTKEESDYGLVSLCESKNGIIAEYDFNLKRMYNAPRYGELAT